MSESQSQTNQCVYLLPVTILSPTFLVNFVVYSSLHNSSVSNHLKDTINPVKAYMMKHTKQ